MYKPIAPAAIENAHSSNQKKSARKLTFPNFFEHILINPTYYQSYAYATFTGALIYTIPASKNYYLSFENRENDLKYNKVRVKKMITFLELTTQICLLMIFII